MKKRSRQSFEYLSKASQVASHKRTKNSLVGLVCFALLGLILYFMLAHHKVNPTKAKLPTSADSSSAIFEQNMAKIEALRAKELQMQHQSLNQALPSRATAPTQMYVLNPKKHLARGVSTSTLSAKNIFSEFANAQQTRFKRVAAEKIQHSMFTIAQGELIHAALETAINSDLPGMTTAVITQPVYAYAGDKPLIPAGSRLIGQYEFAKSNGLASARVFVMWNRIITPGGISIMINSPGADALGQAGMGADAVNHHFMAMFGTATLLSLLGAGIQAQSGPEYGYAIASSFQQATQNSISKNLNVGPTLHIHQGDAVTVFVARDLDLYSSLGVES